jgi:hypothetical protein
MNGNIITESELVMIVKEKISSSQLILYAVHVCACFRVYVCMYVCLFRTSPEGNWYKQENNNVR